MASKKKHFHVSSEQMSRAFWCYKHRGSSVLEDMGLRPDPIATNSSHIWSYEIIDEKKVLLTILKHNLNYTITEND